MHMLDLILSGGVIAAGGYAATAIARAYRDALPAVRALLMADCS